DRFALDVDKPAKTYSTGNRQKVALVAAFASRAPLLVLDEPTSGLDPLMEREFRHCVAEARERGQTVFLSSHMLGEVENAAGPSRLHPATGLVPTLRLDSGVASALAAERLGAKAARAAYVGGQLR
uniref:AAA family ATPase n=1 Tax=Nocardia asiatica TaxID=209252 RepID=UPI0024574D81